jgi:acetyl esterase/lipase
MGMGVNLDQTVEEIEKLFPVDRSKIFVMGHSMGAAQVMTQVSMAPKTPRAAVALGGGRSLPSARKLDDFPWFVAAGQFDFGRNGAKGLADSLLAAKKHVTYREYPDVEHLVIVQAALDDVFAFFDQSNAADKPEEKR